MGMEDLFSIKMKIFGNLYTFFVDFSYLCPQDVTTN